MGINNMAKRLKLKTRYDLTLNTDNAEDVRKEIEKTGGKLSGLIDYLLKNWLKKQRKDKGLAPVWSVEKMRAFIREEMKKE